VSSIGIDLGTTNSVLSRIEGGRPRPIAIDGSPLFPSIVLFDGDRVLAGREARNLELLHPEKTIRSVKRRMGSEHRFAIGDRMLSPEEVSAEILRALCDAAAAHLGEPVEDVVITVPAYFDDAQRRATLRAGELAGLRVLRLLNEPTSASLCYEKMGTSSASEAELVLVYDLGGGTFDVSVLDVFEGVREVRATDGDTHLGGDDFDAKIVARFVEHLREERGVDPREDVRAMVRLRRIAEETKIALSTDTRVTVREEFLTGVAGRSVHLELEVTRRDLEAMIAPMLESTIALARRALGDANVERGALSRVCLVGGSTRIPMVRRLLREAFDLPIHEEIDPDLAVGMGAALQAAMLRGENVERVLVDVASHSLGIRVLGQEDDLYGEADTFAPVLPRNTVLPASRSEEFYTIVDRQEKLRVEVLQGERARASENARVGDFMCDLEPAPARSPVRVEFAYDLDGVVRVRVSQPGHARTKTVALSTAQSAALPETAIERRASAMIDALAERERDELRRMLERVRAAATAKDRAVAEDALLDFIVDHEPADDDEREG
jgi:molecular chaperone DnaK